MSSPNCILSWLPSLRRVAAAATGSTAKGDVAVEGMIKDMIGSTPRCVPHYPARIDWLRALIAQLIAADVTSNAATSFEDRDEQALAALPIVPRLALLLYFGEELTLSEISAVLDVAQHDLINILQDASSAFGADAIISTAPGGGGEPALLEAN
ncbi:MAG: hypothetical protein KF849_13915 [Rhizobiaceae bacterium]|nr:hypothetical protein [Rhizobiaceae bacterium]